MSSGKFQARAVVMQRSRWVFELVEPLVYLDPILGTRVVPAGFVSDLASIRILRDVCRYALLLALAAWLIGWGWVNHAALVVALVALALYALTAGYGLRASILHDYEYLRGELTRRQADGLYYRALHLGDGTAAWRSSIFWCGVRLGGAWRYRYAKSSA